MLKKLLQIREVNELRKDEIEEFFDYEKLNRFILPIACMDTNNDNFFFTADNMLGFGWVVGVKSGIGYETLNFLENGIYQDSQILPNSILQWVLWGGDFVNPLLGSYRGMKDLDSGDIMKIVDSYIDFVKKKSRSYIYEDWQVPVRNVHVFFTVKIPFNLRNMTESRFQERLTSVRQLRDTLESTLFQANFNPYRLSIDDYLIFLTDIHKPGASF